MTGEFLYLCRLEKRERKIGMRLAAVIIRVAWCEVECVIVPRQVSFYVYVDWKREREEDRDSK